MRNNFSRALQTTIIFLVMGGVIALALGGYFSSASNVFTGSLVNLQTWLSSRFIAVQEFLTAPRDVASLRQRNAELEAEVSELQAQVIQLQQRVGETEILAALVDFSRANPDNTYKAAEVIGRDPSPFLHYVIINRGSNDGILRGMPVVTDQGLVGRVDAVIADAARVQLITDPASNVNVRLENAQTDASLVGSVTGDLELELIPQETNVEAGDLVLTSGLGGGYPPDLIVGQVVNIRARDFDLFQQATVQPVVDFNRLQIILVIVNFTPVDIGPLFPTP
ncbi:MAG TPA: rod shape-determining protein MreC [Anaerolineales bacterium]|nr:rod shape-determining protein MreC [Anaerolineales bacterium]HNQ93216.1 rod shape-determining protein MreC [Anaerolineales bacterium]HNS60343.1 rod shape-determining protein MreC [Anaerolineales bacterium]